MIHAERFSRRPIDRHQQAASEAGDAELATHDPALGKQPHAGNRGLIGDRHEGRGRTVQHLPRNDTRLTAGETRHHRVELPRHEPSACPVRR